MAETKENTAGASVPAVWITDVKTAEAVMKVDRLKVAIDQYAQLCDELEVSSEASEKKATELLTDLSAVVKKVEATHKAAKKPYLEGSKACDAVKNTVIGLAEAVILRGKKKIADFREKMRIEQAKKAEEEMKRLQEQSVAAEEKKPEVVNKFLTQINNVYILHNEAIARCGQTKSMDELKAWHLEFSDSINTKFKVSLAPDFPDYVKKVFEDMVKLKNLRKNWFTEGNQDKASYKLVESGFLENMEKYNQIAIKAVEGKDELVEANVQLQAAVVQREVATTKPKGRFKVIWELENFDDVPAEWKQVNPDAIANYIAEHKDDLSPEKMIEPKVIHGIKFKVEEIVVFRNS